MDPRLLEYYNRELHFVREMGGEFAAEFPKIAGRLGLDGQECHDPYVERLLEGFAFMAARVHLKLDAGFPDFTQHLLELVYPNYLAPTPSMAVVELAPDLAEGSLAEGFDVPRGSALRNAPAKGEPTTCEFRTAHDVTLWPLRIAEAEYFTHARGLEGVAPRALRDFRAGLRVRLETTAGVPFSALPLDRLPLYLRGVDERPMRLYRQLVADATGVVVRPVGGGDGHELLEPDAIRRVGFDDAEALLPAGDRSFQGYRLLQEYFAFPHRFMFVAFEGLRRAVARTAGQALDLIVLFDRDEPDLRGAIDASSFAPFCTPAINLFPRRTDRIHLQAGAHEYHVVPDRTRPLDYEVWGMEEVAGYGTAARPEVEFLPFYAADDLGRAGGADAFYTIRRERRVGSSRGGARQRDTAYVGSETYLALVDGDRGPYRTDLRQLGVRALCTNRDLPTLLATGNRRGDFHLETGAPVEAIRCLAGPSAPRPSHAVGDVAWRLISQLSLNYLSLGGEGRDGAELRELLRLHGDAGDPALRKQIEGLRDATTRPIVRRLPGPGPLGFGRGVEVALTFDEASFEGTGSFLLGAVLERFLARYVSLNSFTETVIRTSAGSEVVRWPVRPGDRRTT